MQGTDPLARYARHFTAGTILFEEGQSGEEMYVIHSGRVRLSRRVRGEAQLLAVLPPGEFFGELAIINGRARSATAEVIEDAQLLVLDGKMFEALVRGNAEIALRLIKRLAARLDHANSQVEVLLLRDANHRVVHQLRILADSSGVADGPGVRIDLFDEELAQLVNLTVDEVRLCLERLERAHLIWREGRSLFLPEPHSLGEFLEFLELKERFGQG
jgi:CRP/FNR family transcriptional regulator, cyclic AMP receptor protein